LCSAYLFPNRPLLYSSFLPHTNIVSYQPLHNPTQRLFAIGSAGESGKEEQWANGNR
jgi:hypothetical protein